MKKNRRACCILIMILVTLFTIAASAEGTPADLEQGLEEIQPLLEIAEVEQKDGMSLEEVTDALVESAMNEYIDSETGFCMQYPSIFLFDEDAEGMTAATEDGKATLTIENMESKGTLDEDTITAAIKLETPEAEIQKNELNGCLRVDRFPDGAEFGRTDLYLMTKKSFHHIIIQYPAIEKGTYFTYIEYMINTMETNETDQG